MVENCGICNEMILWGHCQIYIVQWLLSTISNLRAHFRGIWESLYPFFWQICGLFFPKNGKRVGFLLFENIWSFFPEEWQTPLGRQRDVEQEEWSPQFPKACQGPTKPEVLVENIMIALNCYYWYGPTVNSHPKMQKKVRLNIFV